MKKKLTTRNLITNCQITPKIMTCSNNDASNTNNNVLVLTYRQKCTVLFTDISTKIKTQSYKNNYINLS